MNSAFAPSPTTEEVDWTPAPCAVCGRSFSAQEARSGFTTCERCPEPPQASPEVALLRRTWSALDAWRSRDARRMGPELRAIQDEIAVLLRGLPGGFPAERELAETLINEGGAS